MHSNESTISALSQLGEHLQSGGLESRVEQACLENLWFTKENYMDVLDYWSKKLTNNTLTEFVSPYTFKDGKKKVGIIMAGNIPMVGFHDLLCVILSGHKPVVKMSSTDKAVMAHVIQFLNKSTSIDEITVVDNVKGVDAVIATGSNNSFRYFEYYFKNIPRLLRKSRTSVAVISGDESSAQLQALGKDVFHHYGLGCRNVSLILVPRDYDITALLDQWQAFSSLINHNKFANNYTYHKALFLMNNLTHLDTGYVLVKEEKSLHSPLGCVFYARYENESDLSKFITENDIDIQCVVGNYWDVNSIEFGKSQYPDLQDFADNIDTMKFLESIK